LVLKQPEDVAVRVGDGGHQATAPDVVRGLLHYGTRAVTRRSAAVHQECGIHVLGLARSDTGCSTVMPWVDEAVMVTPEVVGVGRIAMTVTLAAAQRSTLLDF
jgi:hypothetical protein